MICRVKEVCKKVCDTHCTMTVGDNIARFLREIDTVDSKIGDIANNDGISKSRFIMSGMQLDVTSNPTHLLSDMSTSIDVTKKFGTVFNKTATMLLSEYVKAANIEDGNELRNKLKNIENNKILILPIKPKMGCEVSAPSGKETKQKETFRSTHVEMVKWFNSPKTNRLECIIITDVIESADHKRCKINIEDYGEKLRLTDVERSLTNSDIDRRLVKMSRFGYVKPVAVVDKNGNGIIIDNTYIYLVDRDSVKTIACWDKQEIKGEAIYEEITKTVMYKKIKKSIGYIAQHRRFIAPYGLVDCNVIEV